jgi:tetratricopeptide (TPR) repeat protein
MKLRPTSVEAALNAGIARYYSGELDRSGRHFKRAIELDPKCAEALKGAAAVAAQTGDAAKALECWNALARMGVADANLAYNAGLALQNASEPEHAIDCYRAAVQLEPGFAEALLNLGHALDAAGRSDEARAEWAKAVELNPELAAQYFA